MRRSVLTLLVLLTSTFSQAATLHVSQQGSGANGLSWETAFATISDALAASATGDHIWVREGVYPETLVLQDGVQVYGGFAGTESSDEFHLRKPKVHVSKIDGTDAVEVVVAGARHAVFDGFEIYALRRLKHSVYVDNLGSATFLLSNCEILDESPVAITSTPPITFLRTLFVSSSRFDCFNCVFREINIDRVTHSAVSASSPHPVRFVNCIFLSRVKGRTSAAGPLDAPSICSTSGSGTRIILINCLLKITGDPGLIAYSINRAYGLFSQTPTGAITGINNIFLTPYRLDDPFGNSYRFYFWFVNNLHPWATGIHPSFVNEANEDFRLLSHSPGIDSGTFTETALRGFFPFPEHHSLLDAPDFDIRGKPRPVDIYGVGGQGEGAYDIGPFELQLDEYTLRSDLNGDGIVDDLDLILLASDWRKVSGP